MYLSGGFLVGGTLLGGIRRCGLIEGGVSVGVSVGVPKAQARPSLFFSASILWSDESTRLLQALMPACCLAPSLMVMD